MAPLVWMWVMVMSGRAGCAGRWAAGLAGTVFLGAGLVDGVYAHAAGAHAWPIRALSVGVGAALLGRLTRPRRSQPAADQAPTACRHLTDEAIETRMRQAGHRLGAPGGRRSPLPGPAGDPDPVRSAVRSFEELLRHRCAMTGVAERVEIRNGVPHSTAVLEVGIPRVARPAGEVVVPIQRPKCRPVESFEITDPVGGDRLRPLPEELTSGLVALVLHDLFRDSRTATGPLSAGERAAVHALIRLVCHESALSEEQAGHAFVEAVRGIGLRPDRRAELREFCRYFAAHAVLAVATRPHTRRLRVEHRHVLPAGRPASTPERLRPVFGLPPFRYRVPLLWPFLAHRYELTVQAPASQFVYWHGITVDGRRQLSGGTSRRWPAGPAAGGAWVELGRNAGFSTATLRTGNLHRAGDGDVACEVQLEEVPPGTHGRALAVSAVSTALVLTYAFLVPYLLNDDADPGVDLLGLLLGLPAFAATWVGQSADRPHTLSVTAWAGLAVAGLTSIAGSLLYLVQAATDSTAAVADVRVLSAPLPTFDAIWLGLAALSAVATVVLAVKLRHRSGRYRRVRSQRPV